MGKRLIIPGADFSANAIEQEPIPVPVEYTLVNGYAASSSPTIVEIDQNASAVLIRVRTGQLFGSYKVKTKTGYTIRGIVTYDTELQSLTPAGGKATTGAVSLSNVQGITEYTLLAENKYSIITFCKTDASQSISANEDIVDYIIRPSE